MRVDNNAIARSILAGTTWMRVPAGVVSMGTSERDCAAVLAEYADLGVRYDWLLKECPIHELTVDAFQMARCLVTNATFALAVPALGLDWRPSGPADHPALVTWAEADAFCSWLSASSGHPISLPTETQWERAARGDDRREFPWGDEFSPARANVRESGRAGTTPVDAHPDGASPFGVLDMAGNVEEWTATIYAPYPGAPSSVPLTEDWALDAHVTRGGSFRLNRDVARCARRHALYEPGSPIGFRLVRTS
ncbi:SUMF1/EgtB/PvdO family nonheme iron enzyme [Kibdelosporangium persicum]|uniref:Formylglycine-generating enzyme n=1 Tax=Kibdelosporangium persicum TaxID=2698649 RepID=A0ABX2FFC1_9PSEU|nr:SUMF1/EgtB/PvdO family nonheme iron enzyme [Kibdelosporangium persicum]NRN69526.1 Formylglycine-generating enzyme [Kibdelosporangium persicum]